MNLPKTATVTFVVLFAGAICWSALAQGNRATDDKPTIRRVKLSGDKLAEIQKQIDDGSLVRLPAFEFDRLLAEAGAGRVTNLTPPLLVETRYRAKYAGSDDGESSLSGTAEWLIRRPASSSSELPLDAMQLALRSAKWSDGQDAAVYRLAGDPRSFLHVPGSNPGALNLEWSARGLPEPGEVQFELRVPVAPLAVLELELPGGMAPTLPQEEALLTGPFAGSGNQSIWRIAFGGISRLELILRRATDVPATLFSQLTATQSLSATEGLGRFEFQIESAKTPFTELLFAHDATFTPASIHVNNLLNWSAAKGNDGTPTVKVFLREPVRSASVVVTGSIQIQLEPNPWFSPGVWLKGAISRSESLRIVLGAGLRFRDWRPNGYRLIRGEIGPDQSYAIEASPMTLAAGVKIADRPSVVLSKRAAAIWTVNQRLEWHIGPDSETLSARTSISATGNRPLTIRFPIPSGWQVERIECGSEEPVWTVFDGGIEVELKSDGRYPELDVRLRRTLRQLPNEKIALPDLMPDGCSGRTGSMIIRVDPAIEAILSDPLMAEMPAVKPPEVSNEQVRVLLSEPNSGWLILRPRPANFRAEARSNIRPGRSGHSIHSTVKVTPNAGLASNLRLTTAGPVSQPWEWRDDANRWIGNAVRIPGDETKSVLHAITAPNILAATLSLAVAKSAGGCEWLVRLPKLIDRPIEIHSDFHAAAESNNRILPIPWIVGDRFHGVLLSPVELAAEEIDSRWKPLEVLATGEFRYQYGSLPPVSTGVTRLPGEIRTPQLLTTLDADGERRSSFRVQVRRWSARTLPIKLPADATEIRLLVAERASSSEPAPETNGMLQVPVPETDEWIPIRIEYRLPKIPGRFVGRLPRVSPTGPFDSDSVQYFWHISPEWQPTSTAGLVYLPGTNWPSHNTPIPDFRQLADLFDRNRDTPSVGPPAIGESASSWLIRQFRNKSVIVDVRVMALVGISPSDSPDRLTGLLQSKGLVFAEGPSGELLTRTEEIERWRLAGEWSGAWPEEITQALAEVTSFGQDPSGRFCTLTRWASTSETNLLAAPPGWRIIEGVGDDSSGIAIYRRDYLESGAWLIAIVIGFVIALTRSQRIRGLLWVLMCAFAVALFMIWPSAGYAIAGPMFLVALFGIIGELWRDRPQPQNHRVLAGTIRTAAPIAGIILAIAIASAAPPISGDVFDVADDEGKVVAVLVPRELLQQLRGTYPTTPPPVVIVSANYAGTSDGGAARFHASLRLITFQNRATLYLPLHDVRFRKISLDGAEARELENGPAGLEVTISGQGVHALEIEFLASVSAIAGEQELKIAVPEVPISKLSFGLPSSAGRIRFGAWRGALRTTTENNLTTFLADLGGNSSIQLRWSGAAGRTPTLSVKEASVGKLRTGSATLIGACEYRVSGGAVREFQIALPANGEVSRLTASSESGVSGLAAARVVNWSILPAADSAPRRLRIELLQPISGRVNFKLEMITNLNSSSPLRLQFPRALGVAQSESYAAIDLHELADAAKTELAGWTESPAEQFLDPIWISLSGTPHLGTIWRAYRATEPGLGHVDLAIRPSGRQLTVSESAIWALEEKRLSGQIESTWTGAAISHIEWTVPKSLSVSDVSGKNVASWSQSQGRVQVWLDRTVSEAIVHWHAMRPLVLPESTSIELPAIGHPSATTTSLIRRVRPSNGSSVVLSAKLKGDAIKAELPGEIAWRCSTDDAITLRRFPPVVSPIPKLQTKVDVQGDRFRSIHTLDLASLAADRPYLLSVVVSPARDDDVQFAAPSPMNTAEIAMPGGKRRWDISIPQARPSNANEIRLEVVSRAAANGSWALPSIEVSSGPTNQLGVSETIVIASNAIALKEATGLERMGPNEWRTTSGNRRAQIVRSNGPNWSDRTRVTSASVFAVRNGKIWMFRANAEVNANQPDLLKISFPDGLKLHSLLVNGVSFIGPEQGPKGIPIHGDGVPQRLDLVWSVTNANFALPEMRGLKGPVEFDVVDYYIRVPPGTELSAPVAPSHFDRGNDNTLASDFNNGVFAGYIAHLRLPISQIAAIHIVEDNRDRLGWQLILASAIWLCVFLLSVVFGQKAWPEQISGLSAVATLVLGPSAALLLLIPLIAVTKRLIQLFGRQTIPDYPAGSVQTS